MVIFYSYVSLPEGNQADVHMVVQGIYSHSFAKNRWEVAHVQRQKIGDFKEYEWRGLPGQIQRFAGEHPLPNIIINNIYIYICV